MTQARIHRLSSWFPLLCSALAFAVVIGSMIARVPAQADEGTSAHLWQLLMVAQLPFIGAFVATADWRHRSSLAIIALQLLALGAAAMPVWLAGY